jgi:hypothetical protein
MQFRDMFIFYGEGLLAPRPAPVLEDHTCRLSEAAYSMYSQLTSRKGEKRNGYRLLVGKPEGRRPQGRPRRRWVDNIKMGLLEIG